MKSTLCFPETSVHSQKINSNNHGMNSHSNMDYCIAAAWIDLVGGDYSSLGGDDWLAVCADIDEGEIYREWFMWQDREVTQEWEAYDPITNYRHVACSREMLIAQIDRIEDTRLF
ncbi:MAG: hypothetical protein JGK24_01395 [Microcoleus sp. PH2017_29_MFU_D_A]|jgi:hypothetical protein|uniref:hypothetical protein n=1 Tax=unclassified Microcoleus TaxID=2642155 RepID=UPI001DF128D2|nr:MULTISPECIES: hypothetical protein [unclassified Microcoleus]MCC3416588.1 hypothetical protein [Microcoleus sp. PH2017_07_MST_O_A]MCC3430055.1 hypothetical protein [Microcoleus sp. PH2017_04_SCI_O_A]MCC3440610.1 hypothetical protein [Microcoleus sp. PH2017_03_ELD_O_A]MCC3465574.1 hypothetical protein [Microcoleus sp. PH2017_06_SFM_O_A]MCC3505917.1 hypothetical protein [Microcoleus sp. PH2017_19_SFW_U_A]MCC3508432.1 hypothetical protein [Microcoleus sp. PH2017_17_BER_D_A]TAE12789.1 MAG: hy